MKYPKKFEKHYASTDRAIRSLGGMDEVANEIKGVAFCSWCAGLSAVKRRIKRTESQIKKYGGGWQHEDTDSIVELIDELTKTK